MDHSKCVNSSLDPHEADRLGVCPDCGGTGEFISGFGGGHVHVPCTNPACSHRKVDR